jgi:glycosyltransferase involved in cell wall biosynthesis
MEVHVPKVIVQVVQHLRPGGIEAMALELQRHAATGLTVHVASLEGEHDTALAAWPRLGPLASRLHFLGKRPGIDMALAWRLRGLLRWLEADAVHTHHVGPLLYGGLAARLAGIRRLVHTEHDAWHLTDPRRRRLQAGLVGLLRPCLVADAALVRDSAEAALPGRRYAVIGNGVDTHRFTPGDRDAARRVLGLPRDVRLVGCAARLESVKGHTHLLQAMTRLPTDVHLALAGEGSLAAVLAEDARSLGLGARVHFLGNVEAMPDFYRALDLFCLPSLREGLPLAPLEAQACGVPCVLTDVGGNREALWSHDGTLVPAGDDATLARALAERLDHAVSDDPRAFVVRQADVRTMTRAYEALYVS